MRFILLLMFGLYLPIAHASDRELAADGDDVRLIISDNYSCDSTIAITIKTTSAAYFDKGAKKIQRLANAARAVLGFECPKISKIEFTGVTDEKLVFRADAAKNKKWAIETYPAPLESFALLFSLYEPDFFHLGTLYKQLKAYKGISDISNTYQFKAFEHQINRLISIVDGNVERFRDYLKAPEKDFDNFEKLSAHHTDILNTIKIYAPDHYSAYNKIYQEVSQSSKHDYWSGRLAAIIENAENNAASIIEDGENRVADVIADALSLLQTSPSDEFRMFVDNYLAKWIEEEAEYYKNTLNDTSLYEIRWASDYAAGLPDAAIAGQLQETNKILRTLPEELVDLITNRLEILKLLGVEVIHESGTGYDDAETIFATGFTLAQEFEDAGYGELGQEVLGETFHYIEHILSSDLQSYKENLKALSFTPEITAAIQEQAIVFEELSTSFEGFNPYKLAAENALQVNRSKICKGVLQEVGVKEKNYEKEISLKGKKITLLELACDLYENAHVVSEFSGNILPGTYILGIKEADGAHSHFRLKTKNVFEKKLQVTERLGEEDTPITGQGWQKYIARLLRPPATGKPNANGVRECDTLAADPYDSGKLSHGIDFEKDDIDLEHFDRAIDACIAAIENDPKDVRQLFQFGRLMWYTGDQETAREYIKLAANADYAPALYYKAEILLSSSEDSNAFIDALDMFKESGKQGYERGTAMLKELNPDGIDFFKKIPPPTKKEIRATISRRGDKNIILFGISTFVRVINIDLKDCFQISPTDFICEYKEVKQCKMRMGDYARNSIIQLGKGYAQGKCNDENSSPSFETFRKQMGGRWEMLSR